MSTTGTDDAALEIVPATADRWSDVAPGVEAYPIDPEGRRVEVGAGFVGIATMFDAAGFRRVLLTDAHSGHLPRHLVRLDLQNS